jgi:hypothetical protein
MEQSTRFELRLSRDRRRELAELAHQCGLSTADLIRLSVGRLLANPGALLGSEPAVLAGRQQGERTSAWTKDGGRAMPSFNENAAHYAAVMASEGLRQAAMGPSNLQTHCPDAPGVLAFAPTLPPATVNAINAAHWRRCLASALATGVNPSQFLTALAECGAQP